MISPLDILLRFPLFRVVPPALLAEWSRQAHCVSFSLGEVFFREGSRGEWAYFILQGRVRVVRRKEEKETTVASLSAGQLFGDYALVNPGRNTATCRAASDVQVVQIPLLPIRKWLEKSPAISASLKSWLQLHQLVNHLRGHPEQGFMSSKSALAMAPHLLTLDMEAMLAVQTAGLCDDWWFFIENGEIQVDAEQRSPTILGPGHTFGENALRGSNIPFATTLTSVRCRALPRSFFVRPAQAVAEHSGQTYAAKSIFEPGRVRWIGQREAADCGLAALAMVCFHYGIPATMDELRSQVRIGELGLSALELLALAKSRGLEGHAIRVSIAQMPLAQTPAIVHIDRDTQTGHYVVLFRLTDQGAYLGDPASGMTTMGLTQFANRCSGRILLISPLPH